MKLRRLTRLALLTAVALTIFLVELQIPSVVPIPGVKLGLSNIITLYCVFAYAPWRCSCAGSCWGRCAPAGSWPWPIPWQAVC